MDFDKALHSTRVVLPQGVKDATVFLKNGKIARVFEGRLPAGTAGAEALEELGDAVLMPGLIDAHVHINEPGRADWEGFDTATRAAAAGGVTSLIEMPLNASPVTTTVAAFEQKLAAAEGKLHVHCGFYGGLVPANLGDLPALLRSGVFGIKCFLTHSGIEEFPNVGAEELRRAMPLIERSGLPLLVHAELDEPHAGIERLRQNPTSYAAYLGSRPKSWENRAIELMLELCAATRCRTHIVHLSSADLLQQLAGAKRRLPLTVETAPHYLYFAAEDLPDGRTAYKCAPPIRERANNARLWQGLADGTIDFIGSDHSPAPPALKEMATGNLARAWGGIAGLQFTLPVVWTRARALGFGPEDLARWLCRHPADFLGLAGKGMIAEGKDADLTVWAPEDDFTVEEKDIQHRHKITPYLGERLYGRVLRTYVSGELVFKRGEFRRLQQGRVLRRT
jgi:allantoinase